MSLYQHIESDVPEMLRLLEESVNIDSPSNSKDQIAVMADWYEACFTRLTGGRVQRLNHPQAGDRLLCEIGDGQRQILLVGHYDTVWPLGEAGRRPFRIEDGKAYGPGVYDMKTGVLQAIFALKAILETGRFPDDKKVVLLLNSDEEIGSPTSRAWIEDVAMRSEAAFVLEPPMEPGGALKTSRKGSGRFKLTARGVSAHAGVAPQNGVSAIHELASQIVKLHALTDYTVGTTVNVGTINGGIGSNVVADYAEAEIDVRVATAEEEKRIDAELTSLTPVLQHAKLSVTGGMMRPPMERTAAIAQLFELAQRIASDEFAVTLEEASTGGVSDGNFTAAIGIPTLDGLGARGDHAHSPLEYVSIDEIPLRTALLARLIQSC
jgi:glutamate carboxypeptidase